MCGRFAVDATPEEIARHFQLESAPETPPRYNVAPTQAVTVVHRDPSGVGGRRATAVRWGLIPNGAPDPSVGGRLINARAETVAVKPTFRVQFLGQRCLVPATGFFEWRTVGGKRYPVYYSLAGGGLFAFAGLYDTWRAATGETVPSCTILTTEPNTLVAPVHDRMPVIFGPSSYDTWLSAKAEIPDLQALLTTFPAERMTKWPVSPDMNSPSVDTHACLAEVPEPQSIELDLFS